MRKNITLTMLAALLASCLMLSACATHSGYQGAASGAAVGATAGALLENGNKWRAGVIGGALGATLGGALGEIAGRR